MRLSLRSLRPLEGPFLGVISGSLPHYSDEDLSERSEPTTLVVQGFSVLDLLLHDHSTSLQSRQTMITPTPLRLSLERRTWGGWMGRFFLSTASAVNFPNDERSPK
jgi:hypothetical protein